MKTIRYTYCAAVVLSLGIAANRLSAAENNTSYYEKDGWLDITEWFDGNDYNPTDEVWWRWDDETYDREEDEGTDTDSDGAWYGYTTVGDNDWYYDYYDPFIYRYYSTENDGVYESVSRYFDYDQDGFYDAMSTFWDSDGDGRYENYDYYSFNTSGTGKQKQGAEKNSVSNSRQQSVTGEIQNTKRVEVRGGKEHLVVSIQPKGRRLQDNQRTSDNQDQEDQKDQEKQAQRNQQNQQNQLVMADLGRADALKNINPKQGDQITVKGPRAKVGKKTIVLAHSFDLNGQSRKVNRNARTHTGTVVDTRTTTIRGREHCIAMVERSKGGEKERIAVDLGPADQLKTKPEKGTPLTFTGVSVKVNNKPLVMANSIQTGGETIQIRRKAESANGRSESTNGR